MNIRHLNSTHNDWVRALQFYKEEILILRQRLNEVASKNAAQEVLAEVEHYENQFSLHTEVIENLLNDIKANIAATRKELAKRSGFDSDDHLPVKMDQLEQQYIVEEKLVLELRQPFSRFCAEWM
ncbi:hypothetical protein [Filimonas effusa]|uniref:Uncharacterized protein n=1 Tax=Filimonas effusa TaxID=2508721 RepID=A0A4Q1DC69_9BACT|nr:hypothetical protein [Filimonas effusa]RXK86940.1 hypothetical protein ESB13_09185 [Filimonas effusa]